MNLFRKKAISEVTGDTTGEAHSLAKQLGVRDLTGLGIAAIIGAGIFSTIGNASASGGPGVIFLFIFTAIACGFAAFAYAEFASLVPVSGSAYTYSYVTFGELIAWIMGWALIMEYAIGNITVAISWSDYFTEMLRRVGMELPTWSTMDYFSAKNGHAEAMSLLNGGTTMNSLSDGLKATYLAWTESPVFLGFHLILDIPALIIIALVTYLVYRGMRESRNASNIMVGIKLTVVLLVIAVGAFYIDTENWNPFMPNGISGVLKGVSAVFFAYIGFDALSTTAEECKNPQRDLPRGMMWSIIICTILYIAIALTLTGMVSFSELNVGDPLAHVFQKLGISWMTGIVSISAVVAMTGVLIVFQLGQPRIWMSMSRDGLLPRPFSRVHPRFKTPGFATIVTGFMVGIPALFMNISMVTDLCSIGTLFAFVLVCGGVLKLQMTEDAPRGKFKTPYINGRFIYPLLLLGGVSISFSVYKKETTDFIFNKPRTLSADEITKSFTKEESAVALSYLESNDHHGLEESGNDLQKYLSSLSPAQYEETIKNLPVDVSKKAEGGWSLFRHKIPVWIFILVSFLLVIPVMKHALSLIPLMGLLSCLYMMSQLGYHNWIGFGSWLILGLFIYFGYGYRNSKLASVQTNL
ncbi:MAG: amino acid permease [Bacteroidota bacterium]